MLLVHGITTYSFIWRRLIPLLERSYDVIAIDLLGCGASDKPLDVSYSIQDHAQRLHEFCEVLGIEKCHLVGHDLGGGITQIFGVNHPEMLYDMTLINTVAYDFWPVQPITALRTPILRQLMMASFDLGTFRLVVKRGVYHAERVDDELMGLFMDPLSTTEGRQAFMHFARCLDNHNLTQITEELRALSVPTLIVRGDKDPYLDAIIAQRLHEGMPSSRLVHIETASHFAQEDEPEQLAELILSFANEHHG